jgi:hypothetical protein
VRRKKIQERQKISKCQSICNMIDLQISNMYMNIFGTVQTNFDNFVALIWLTVLALWETCTNVVSGFQ